jgi:hypothetical protein
MKKLSLLTILTLAGGALRAVPCNEGFGDAFMENLLSSVAKHDPQLMRGVLDGVIFIPAFHGEPHIDSPEKVEQYYTKLFQAKPDLLVTGAIKAEFNHDLTNVWVRDGQYLVTWTDPKTNKPDQSLLRYTLVYAPTSEDHCKIVMLRASSICDGAAGKTAAEPAKNETRTASSPEQ